MKLKDKIVLITGASRGIGAAVAKRLAAEGAHLILIARTEGGLIETDDAVRAAGGSATLVPLDLTSDLDAIDRLGASLQDRFGRLDVFIGNAAILGALGPLPHADPAFFNKLMTLNVTANYRLLRSLHPLLLQSQDAHVLFSGCAIAKTPTAFWGMYGASKAALAYLADSYAAEVAGSGIKVSTIDPGPTATALFQKAYPGIDPASLQTPDQAAAFYATALGL
jgi:NAD(P)-dependent dehydrogenase (short-subunit alcohol dehydrogenase family)